MPMTNQLRKHFLYYDLQINNDAGGLVARV